jgi:hypothetical protein
VLQFFEKRHVQSAIDSRHSRPLGAGKWVNDLQPRKPAEVAVSANEFRNAVLEAESHNVSVVMNQDVGVNRLHELAPIHEIEQGVTVQQVDSGLFCRFPASKSQAVRFRGAGGQGAPKKVIGHRLQGSALLRGLFLQLAGELIVNRQGGSFHMQKHVMPASRCQAFRG